MFWRFLHYIGFHLSSHMRFNYLQICILATVYLFLLHATYPVLRIYKAVYTVYMLNKLYTWLVTPLMKYPHVTALLMPHHWVLGEFLVQSSLLIIKITQLQFKSNLLKETACQFLGHLGYNS